MSARIFENIIFESCGDTSLVRLLLYMLMITEKDILAKEDPDDRWRYVSHGIFIVDCVEKAEYWNILVKEYLEYDLVYAMKKREEFRQEMK